MLALALEPSELARPGSCGSWQAALGHWQVTSGQLRCQVMPIAPAREVQMAGDALNPRWQVTQPPEQQGVGAVTVC